MVLDEFSHVFYYTNILSKACSESKGSCIKGGSKVERMILKVAFSKSEPADNTN